MAHELMGFIEIDVAVLEDAQALRAALVNHYHQLRREEQAIFMMLKEFDERIESGEKESWHDQYHDGPSWYPKHVGNFVLAKSFLVTNPTFFMSQNRRKERLLGHLMESWMAYTEWGRSATGRLRWRHRRLVELFMGFAILLHIAVTKAQARGYNHRGANQIVDFNSVLALV